MPISATDARALFTKALIDVYQERIRPTGFLRSFFPAVNTPSKLVSIEVERMGEKIAVDVLRGTEGNRNAFSKSTEKIFEPPFYREYFDATQLDLYDRVLGSQGNVQRPLFVALMNTVADRLGLLQDKIERSIELQCASVLTSGTVVTEFGTIDYKRKADSMVNSAGNYFSGNSNPWAGFKAAAEFLRVKGRTNDGIFNAILGQDALEDLLANTAFQTRGDLKNITLDVITGPARSGNGAVLHGQIVAGSWKFNLWTYPQYYQDAAGVDQQYINPKDVIVIPSAPRFKTAFAATPRVLTPGGTVPAPQSYYIGEYMDERKAVHDFDIQAAPLAVPVAVDQIFTFRAKA